MQVALAQARVAALLEFHIRIVCFFYVRNGNSAALTYTSATSVHEASTHSNSSWLKMADLTAGRGRVSKRSKNYNHSLPRGPVLRCLLWVQTYAHKQVKSVLLLQPASLMKVALVAQPWEHVGRSVVFWAATNAAKATTRAAVNCILMVVRVYRAG
jgi:hypothetical protein